MLELIEVLRQCKAESVVLNLNNGRLQASYDTLISDSLRAQLQANKDELEVFVAEQLVVNAQARLEIMPIDRTNGAVLSFGQQRLWFIDRIEGSSSQYNISAAIQLKGQLNFAATEQAVANIIERHEVLRSVYRLVGDNAEQIVKNDFEFKLVKHDLSALEPNGVREQLRKLILQERKYNFDLSGELMLRVTWLVIPSKDKIPTAILVFNLHHIAGDGWSIGLLIKEFIAHYRSIVEGVSNPLPPLPIQYGDYAHWQRNYLHGEVFERHMDYWLEYLKGSKQMHSLPLDKPRPPRQSFRGKIHHIEIGHELLGRIERLALANNATLFMVLQSVYALLLSRVSKQSDIIMGTPIAGRDRPIFESLVGCFANTTIVRTLCDPNFTYRELLQQTKQKAIACNDHNAIPFEALVERLKPERSLSYNPLFQIWFVLQNQPHEVLELPGVEIEDVDIASGTTQFDLELNVAIRKMQSQHSLLLNWTYAVDLFEQSTISYLAQSYIRLLEAVVEDADQKITELLLANKASLVEKAKQSIKHKVMGKRFKRKPASTPKEQ